jgi:hypothetical protein
VFKFVEERDDPHLAINRGGDRRMHAFSSGNRHAQPDPEPRRHPEKLEHGRA